MTLLRRPRTRLDDGRRASVARPAAVVGFVLALAATYRAGRADEERASTRYARETVRELVWRYRLRHGERCPRDLATLARESSRRELPRDGWGEPFALRCPSPREGRDFDVVSAGPDRIPGGLDVLD